MGLGLARATALSPTSPVLDPLDEFQPSESPDRRGRRASGTRAGCGTRGWTTSARWIATPATSSRSERPCRSRSGRRSDWSVAAGADYDLANTWFGNADAVVRYTALDDGDGGLRQYRPHFDLWTIWGVFSPVPYHAADAAVFVRPDPLARAPGRGERYAYSDTETETPLVDVDDDGWRLGVGVSYSLGSAWSFDAGYREEYGPGASSHGFDGSVTWLPTTDALDHRATGPPWTARSSSGSTRRRSTSRCRRRVERRQSAAPGDRGRAVLGIPRPAGCRGLRLGPDQAARPGDPAPAE